MHRQEAHSMRLLAQWLCEFFRTAIAGPNRASMKPPQFNPGWPADVQALNRHDMQEIWDPSIAPQIWNQLSIVAGVPARLLRLRDL